MLRKLAAISMIMAMPMMNAQADPSIDDAPKLDFDRHFRELLKGFEPQLKDLMQEMKPALEDAMKFMDQLKAMDDPRHYEMPEVLPNGDIIIRRREDAPAYEPPEDPAEPEDTDSIKT